MIIPLLRIALVSRQEYTCEFYRRMLSDREDVAIETYASIDELKKGCQGKHYAGLMIDMWTHVGAPHADKEFVYSLDRIFPILYIGDQDEKPSGFQSVADWRSSRQHEFSILEDYLNNQCRPMKPRGIRSAVRKQLFFSAQVRFGERKTPIRTNTWNVSPQGCFLIASEEYASGAPVWLSIADLSDTSAIAGEIKWSRPWGGDYRLLPGAGIAFKAISPAQDRALASLLK